MEFFVLYRFNNQMLHSFTLFRILLCCNIRINSQNNRDKLRNCLRHFKLQLVLQVFSPVDGIFILKDVSLIAKCALKNMPGNRKYNSRLEPRVFCKIFLTFLVVFLFSIFSTVCYAQFEYIVSKNDFTNLVGKEYSDCSELGDFTLKSMSNIGEQMGQTIYITNLVQNEKQIITSEVSSIDVLTNKEVHKILDVVVLKGYYTICCGCFLSKKKKNDVVSVYPLGHTNDDLMMIAFERNGRTGKYKKVKSGKLKQNPLRQN